MDTDELPKYSRYDHGIQNTPLGSRRRSQRRKGALRLILVSLALYVFYYYLTPQVSDERKQLLSVENLRANYDQCARLRAVAKDPSGPRNANLRYNGGKPTLIRNATIWTGEAASGTTPQQEKLGIGYSWERADVLIEQGLIKRIARSIEIHDLPKGCIVHDGTGRLLTTGIVDMHSHTGVDPLPDSKGGDDTNELSSDITPYVRSLDGINPLDPQIQVIKSGGVTTSLILPGSGNNMGGEAFVIKLAVGKSDGRPELSAEDMLADHEHNWRYMKMACGENPKRIYGVSGRSFGPFSRLGEAWYFRHAFEQAQKLVTAQDDWCAAADRLGAENMPSYLPQELEWESLGALLRGQVLLNTHCYTIPDLEAFIRHTNEFNFSVRAFHHAHQTYLVPEILKRNYGGRPPAAALFADNMYYKTESYVGSEQAGKILYENGITPVYVSDNPVLNAQHVVFEAAKAYKNGLPYHVALAGVTSASAELLGLGERIGKIKEGFDADLTLWDSDPLSVGATPVQVWIDGFAQFEHPVELKKPDAIPLEHFSRPEPVTVESDLYETIVFANVDSIALPNHQQTLSSDDKIVIQNGKISCVGICHEQMQHKSGQNIPTIDLHGGHIVPPAIAFGSYLGLEEIKAEPATTDGKNSPDSFSAAIDGLALDGKALRAAYAHGVTRAISAPNFRGGGHRGISVDFRVGAGHALESGAVLNRAVAVHYTLNLESKQGNTPSFSSALGTLRAKLYKAIKANITDLEVGSEARALYEVVHGHLPLVVTAHKADIIASVISIKAEIEAEIGQQSSVSATPTNFKHQIRFIILGGAEAYIVASELADASVSVVLAPSFPYATEWDQRRSLTGAPLTNGTAIDILHKAGVRLALGTAEDWETRDLYLMAGIAQANSGGKISPKQALKMISSNIDEMLATSHKEESAHDEFVVFDGNPLEIGSRLRAVADGRGKVEVWRESSA